MQPLDISSPVALLPSVTSPLPPISEIPEAPFLDNQAPPAPVPAPSFWNRLCNNIATFCPERVLKSAAQIKTFASSAFETMAGQVKKVTDKVANKGREIGTDALVGGIKFAIASAQSAQENETISSIGQAIFSHAPQCVKDAAEQLCVAYVDPAVNDIIRNDNAVVKQHRQTLKELSANPYFERTLSLIASRISHAIEEKYKDANFFKLFEQTRKAIPELVERVLITAFANLAKQAVPPGTKSDNLLQDILNYIVKQTKDHIDGVDGAEAIKGIKHRLKDYNPGDAKEREELCALFKPLHTKLIKIALPNGIESFGFGSMTNTLFNAVGLPLLEDPSLFVSLYEKLIDPIKQVEERTKLLNGTAGGRILLRCANLGADQGPKLLFQLLGEMSPVVAEAIIPEEHIEAPTDADKKRIANKQACRFKLDKQFKEIASVNCLPKEVIQRIAELEKLIAGCKEKDPQLQIYKDELRNIYLPEAIEKRRAADAARMNELHKLMADCKDARRLETYRSELSAIASRETSNDISRLGGTVIHSVMTKLFLNLAEKGKGAKLVEEEDPLPHVVNALVKELKDFYNTHGKVLRSQFEELHLCYAKYKANMKRLADIKQALPDCKDPREASKLHGELADIHNWFTAWESQDTQMDRLVEIEKVLLDCKNPNEALKLRKELADIHNWFTVWKDQGIPDHKKRKQLINDIFNPFAKAILKATGLDQVNGIRLDLGNLNDIIQSKIGLGFRILYEKILLFRWGGIPKWLHPEEAVQKKMDALAKTTGNDHFSNLTKAAAAPLTTLIGDILSNDNNIADKTVDAIRLILPNSINLAIPEADKKDLVLAFKAFFKNIFSRPEGDVLKTFLNTHLQETLLDMLQKNSDSSNPLAALITRCMEAVQNFNQKFQKDHGVSLAAIYADKNAGKPEELFEKCQTAYNNPFDDLLKELLAAAGLTTLLNGKLAVFNLDQAIKPAIIHSLFAIHHKFTHQQPKQDAIQDQLCAALYDQEGFQKKLMGSTPENSSVAQVHAVAADPKGKPQDERNKLWVASGAHGHADFATQSGALAAHMVTNAIRSQLEQNSGAIIQLLTDGKDGKPAFLQGIKPEEAAALKACLEACVAKPKDNQPNHPVNALWTTIESFLGSGMLQGVANLIDSTDPLMPRSAGEHRQWPLLGDIAARVTQAVGEFLKKDKKAEEAGKIKLEMASLKGKAEHIKEYTALNKKLIALFMPLAKELIGMVTGKPDEKPSLIGKQNPLSALPLDVLYISDEKRAKIWNNLLPEVLSEQLALIFDKATPDIQQSRNELFQLSGGNHIAEYCKSLAECIRDVTPYSLHAEQEKIGKMLFASIQSFLKTEASGKALHDNLNGQQELVQKMFSHVIGQLGANSDREGTMKDFVWPFLEKYSEPMLLTVALRMGKHMESIQKNDSSFMLKLTNRLMTTITKHLKKVHEVTQKRKESAAYNVSERDMKEGFGDQLHPGLRKGLNAVSKEESEQLLMDELYIPLAEEMIEFLDVKKEDIPAPAYLQEPMFALLKKQLAPLGLKLMFDLMFRGDGKEPLIDRMIAAAFANAKKAADAISPYVEPKPNGLFFKPGESLLLDDMRAICAEFYQVIAKFPPDWFAQKVLSIETFKNMTADMVVSTMKNLFKEWTPLKLFDKGAEIGLPAFRAGVWKGEGEKRRFVPEKRDFDFSVKPPEEAARIAEAEEQRARDIKCESAEVLTKKVVEGLQTPFVNLWNKIEQGILWICQKLFGKHAEAVKNVIVGGFKYLGILLKYILFPITYVIERIIYGIMKLQVAFGFRIIRMPIHKQLVVDVTKGMLDAFKDAKQAVVPKPAAAAPA